MNIVLALLGPAYPWIKVAHIVFVLFWMAGLFMLPRFYAYHQETERDSLEWKAWIDREARLIRIILNPSMIAVWAFGFMLVLILGVGREPWFIVKFIAVGFLTAYHFWMVAYARRFQTGTIFVANRTMRLLNEIPGLVAIIAVIMVIVRPALT